MSDKIDYVKQFYQLAKMDSVKDNYQLVVLLREFYKIQEKLQEEQKQCQEMITHLKRKIGL